MYILMVNSISYFVLLIMMTLSHLKAVFQYQIKRFSSNRYAYLIPVVVITSSSLNLVGYLLLHNELFQILCQLEFFSPSLHMIIFY